MENAKKIISPALVEPKGEPLLSLRNVSLSYWLKGRSLFKHRKFWALKDVSFDLYKGESLGVIGRNGAGKSTLLTLLGGIVSPDSGTITFREDVSASLLSMNLGQMPHLTGRENAVQGALFQGLNVHDFMSKLDDIKEFSGLGDFFEEPIRTYSSGMRARLAFSVAFQINPTILLIDELLGVGDEDFRQKSIAAMKERINSEHQTVVYVTHNKNMVRELCARAIWIEDGKIKQQGKCGEVVRDFLESQKKK